MYTISVTKVSPEEEKNCILPLKSEEDAEQLLSKLLETKDKLDDKVVLLRLSLIMIALFGMWSCCIFYDIGYSLHKISIQRMSEK